MKLKLLGKMVECPNQSQPTVGAPCIIMIMLMANAVSDSFRLERTELGGESRGIVTFFESDEKLLFKIGEFRFPK